MILPDVNVLLYAFRLDSSHHAACHHWLEQLVNAHAAYGVSPQVLSSVVRISTHPRIYAQPSRLEEAIGFCRTLTQGDTCCLIQPGERHWEIFLDLCLKTNARGSLVPDAWFAALAIESGCEWVTTDRDYARFPGLRWSTPF